MKVITALFEEDNYCKVSGLWQYDYGQILSIEGLNLPKIVEIHFSLDDKNGDTITRIGLTENSITMPVKARPKPNVSESSEDPGMFHEVIGAVNKVSSETEQAKKEAESWAHGHEEYPDRQKDNAAYYANEAKNAAKEVPGRVKEGKRQIDDYVREKESQLKGETGNVYFAGFAVVKGRLKMYSDPTVDKVRFRREGSRLKYRLAL